MSKDKTLRQWLDEERGRATALAAKLGVTISAVTQVADGDIRVPPSWYAVIVEMSEGEVPFERLLQPTKAAA